MPVNNQAEDRYNPPAVGNDDFDQMKFSDIDEGDLFWLNASRDNNPPYRKFDNNEGGNIKTRLIESFDPNQVVYQRT